MKYLVFTDLDGSLLDHYDYSFEPARPILQALDQQAIPVICATSKTFAELVRLRGSLGNSHPFIVENGAAVYIPKTYFSHQLDAGEAVHEESEGYDCYAFVQPRRHWQQLITAQSERYAGQFETFESLGAAGIARYTGLSLDDARLANQREFGEPVMWTGDATARESFIDHLIQDGASVLQGGRFMHISGACDKGAALRWLKAVYEQEAGQVMTSVAAGDSGNDVAMLEAADCSVIVRSPAHQPPKVNKHEETWITDSTGPQGWAEGIKRFIPLE